MLVVCQMIASVMLDFEFLAIWFCGAPTTCARGVGRARGTMYKKGHFCAILTDSVRQGCRCGHNRLARPAQPPRCREFEILWVGVQRPLQSNFPPRHPQSRARSCAVRAPCARPPHSTRSSRLTRIAHRKLQTVLLDLRNSPFRAQGSHRW